MSQHFDSVDEYIVQFPGDVQEVLQEVRRRCAAAVPDSGEMISYGIPTVTPDGKYVVYFAGWAHHVSVYPVPSGDDAFQTEIAPFRAAKGTLVFPLGKPLPYGLIERTAAFLAAERRAGGNGCPYVPPSNAYDGGANEGGRARRTLWAPNPRSPVTSAPTHRPSARFPHTDGRRCSPAFPLIALLRDIRPPQQPQ